MLQVQRSDGHGMVDCNHSGIVINIEEFVTRIINVYFMSGSEEDTYEYISCADSLLALS